MPAMNMTARRELSITPLASSRRLSLSKWIGVTLVLIYLRANGPAHGLPPSLFGKAHPSSEGYHLGEMFYL